MPSQGPCSTTDTRIITGLFCVLASSILLTCPLGASSHEIAASVDSDFPDSQKAWADITRSTLRASASASTPPANQSVCRAKLVYTTGSFVDQARYAAQLISRTRLDDETSLLIKFEEIYSAKLGPPMAGEESPLDAFEKTSTAYADDQYCLVLVELPMAQHLNGMAWVCGVCKTNKNVAIVNAFMDDSRTFSVIMHELGHLLCATHNSGGGAMRPTAVGDGKIGTYSGLAVAQISEMTRVAPGICNEKQWDAETQVVSAHTNANTGRCKNCRKDHEHHWEYDETLAVSMGFFILFLLLFVLFIPIFCLEPVIY